MRADNGAALRNSSQQPDPGLHFPLVGGCEQQCIQRLLGSPPPGRHRSLRSPRAAGSVLLSCIGTWTSEPKAHALLYNGTLCCRCSRHIAFELSISVPTELQLQESNAATACSSRPVIRVCHMPQSQWER